MKQGLYLEGCNLELSKIVKSISNIQGVKAIVLGGSQSRNEADEHSDFDIGLYYDANILGLVALGQNLKELDDSHRENLLNPPGQWGPWINGGAWLTVDDISYRSTIPVNHLRNRNINTV